MQVLINPSQSIVPLLELGYVVAEIKLKRLLTSSDPCFSYIYIHDENQVYESLIHECISCK